MIEEIKKYWIYILVSVVVLFVMISSLFIHPVPKSNSPKPPVYSTPVSSPIISTPQNDGVYVTPPDPNEIAKDQAKKVIFNKLPYYGQNFSVSYDFSKAGFTATINPTNHAQGLQELNQFLSSYNLTTADFNNLVIK